MDRSSLEDEVEIHRLLARYCHSCDDGDFDSLIDLFVEEASFVYEKSAPSGRIAIRRWFESTQPPERRGKHLTTNIVVTLHGDDASVISDFVFLAGSDSRLSPQVAGRYLDDLRYDEGQWRFARRMAVPL
jgi:3-phenylpropionate/cinnamic acid dioxygenase small subunit